MERELVLHGRALEKDAGPKAIDSRDPAASLITPSDLLNCLLLAAIPVVMSVVNSEWLYTGIGSIDPWVNVGYFLHYSDPEFGATYYKAARLSWIIPGFIAYHVFQPIVANYILHMGCLILSVLFFYLTVARLFGRAVAFPIAACLAVYIPFHGSGGWDYQNAASGAFYIVAFYLLTSAALSKQPRWLAIGAGAAYAAALHAAIGFVNLAPILIFHCFALYRHQFGRFPSWRYVLWNGVLILFGALILTVLLGLANCMVGRELIFFKPLLDLVISFLQDSHNQASWWLPWSKGWFLDVYSLGYLVLSFATLVGCVVCTVLAMFRWRFDTIALSLQVQYIFVSLLWLVWQSLGQTALQPDYFAYPIYPVMFFGLAGIAAAWRRSAGPSRATIVFYVLVALIVAIPLCVPLMGSTLPHLTKLHVQLILVASALIVVGLFAIGGGRPALVAAAVLAFAAMNSFEVAANGRQNLYSFAPACTDRSDAYTALLDSDIFLNRFVTTSDNMYVWWNKDEGLKGEQQCGMRAAHFAPSLAALGLFNYLSPPWSGMPAADALPGESIAEITKDSTAKIAIPTADYTNVVAIIARYHRAGVKLAVEGKTIIRTPRFSFSLYVLGVNSEQEEPTPEAIAGARVVPLRGMTLGSHGASLQLSASGVAFRSAPERRSYIGRMPLLAGCIQSGGWVAADIRVTQGTVGIGVLNRKGNEVLVSGPAAASDKVQTVFLRLDSFAASGDLALRNWDTRSSSEGILQAVRVAAEDGSTPAACDPDPARTKALAQARSLSLETMTLGAEGASLQASASGVAFRSLPDPWAYIGRMPLDAGCMEGGGWVAADIRVTRGTVGVGVLNREGDDFLVSGSATISDDVQTIFLPLDSFAAAGDLILRNWDERSSSEGILQAVRSAAEDGPTPGTCDRK